MLDGSDFSGGTEIWSDPQKLFQGGTDVDGAVTDGVTRLLLRMPLNSRASVTFTLQGTGNPFEDGVLRSIDGSVPEGNTISVNSMTVNGSQYAFAIYQAPGDFVRQGVDLNGDGVPDDSIISERTISLKIKVGDNPETSTDIKLDRPPVVLIHGLWSNSIDTWVKNGIFQNLLSQFLGITIYYFDYYNDRHFEENHEKIELAVEESKSLMRAKEIAVTQVDVIAHSMGGVLARIYAEGDRWNGHEAYLTDKNFSKGNINKFITLDTPHSGSFLADAALERIAHLDKRLSDFLVNQFEANGKPLTHGAVDDLASSSEALKKMGQLDIAPTSSSAIIGDYIVPSGNVGLIANGDLKNAHRLLINLRHDTRPDIIQGHSDLVVSVASQAGGLIGLSSRSFGHDHFGINSNNVFNRLVELLNAPKTDPVFAEDGFPARK